VLTGGSDVVGELKSTREAMLKFRDRGGSEG